MTEKDRRTHVMHAAIAARCNRQVTSMNFRQPLLFIGALIGLFFSALFGHATAAEPLRGPGLGNLTYTSAELFTPISWIRRDDRGTPAA